ncbi:MAG: SDR family oxidoreductase [Bacteroidota bacterium]
MNFTNKTVLITGASSGIGKSFAYLLAAQGAHLILVARTLNVLEEIAEDIRSKHQREVHIIRKDLSAVGSAAELYQEVQGRSLTVDVLINNAGFGKWGKFEDFPWDDYQRMIQLNTTSLVELCYLFLDQLKAQPEAGIINVGSTASFIPIPYSGVYGATKGFVLSFSEAMTGELAGTKITVSCLCPGGTESNFSKVADPSQSADLSNTNYLSSDEVAQIGIDAFEAKKHYVITGRKSQLTLMKFMSRKRIVAMVASYWRKTLNIAA